MTELKDVLKPIPVEERLPQREDCDKEDRCWLWRTDGVEEFWELAILPYKVHEYNESSLWNYTHWLPHYAIPYPQ
jgi:hypothetical protein